MTNIEAIKKRIFESTEENHIKTLLSALNDLEHVVPRESISEILRDSNENTLLHMLVMHRNLEGLRIIISKNLFNIDSVNFAGHTALHWAAHHGFTEILDFLISCSTDETIAKTTANGNTILLLAAREGHTGMVDYLSKNPKTKHLIHIQNNEYFSPLDIAVRSNFSDIVTILSRTHEELSQVPLFAHTEGASEAFAGTGVFDGIAAHALQFQGQNEIDMLKEGIFRSANMRDFQQMMITIDKLKLLNPDLDLNTFLVYENGDSLLHILVQNNCPELMVTLIREYGFLTNMANNSGKTPMHLAVERNLIKELDILISHTRDNEFAQKSNDGDTILMLAVKAKNVDIIKYFRQNDKLNHLIIIKDNDGRSPHDIARKDNIKIIKVLLSQMDVIHSNSVSVASGSFRTIDDPIESLKSDIQTCSVMGSREEMKMLINRLLELRPDIDLKSFLIYEGQTSILHMAAYIDDPAMVEYLILEHGYDASIVTNLNYTPIHFAAYYGSLDSLDKLISLSSNDTINARISNGDSALSICVKKGFDHIVNYLIHNPKTKDLIYQKNLRGQSPYDIAKEKGNEAIIAMFEEVIASDSAAAAQGFSQVEDENPDHADGDHYFDTALAGDLEGSGE